MLFKNFSGKKNLSEPLSSIQHLQRLVNNFYKDNLQKVIENFPPIDSAQPTTGPTIRTEAQIKKKLRPTS